MALGAAVERRDAVGTEVGLALLGGKTRKLLGNDVGRAEVRFDVLSIAMIFPHKPIMSLLLILLLLEEDMNHSLLHYFKIALNPIHCSLAILHHRHVFLLLSC